MEEYQEDKPVSGASGLAKAPLANPKQTAKAGNKPNAQASGQKPGPKRARWWVALATAVTLLIPMLHKELGEDPGPEPTVTSAAFAKSHGKEVKKVQAKKTKKAVAKNKAPQSDTSHQIDDAAMGVKDRMADYYQAVIAEAAETPAQKQLKQAEQDAAGTYAQMRAAAAAKQSVEAFRVARENTGAPPMNYEALKRAQTEATLLAADTYQAAVTRVFASPDAQTQKSTQQKATKPAWPTASR